MSEKAGSVGFKRVLGEGGGEVYKKTSLEK